VIKGFKSFARETEINFDRHMNVVVGPNGSGKSNITDALCFVLGRLSIKSIRATKSAHLIFSGNKFYKPATIAYVELILDNSNKVFSLDENEIKIRRIVNKTGQSTYKINNQTKTRQEVLELLSQAGIDPHGFNIILQGEIMRFVKMPSEERKKIIEEVSGISIYEIRKEKSLKELEKTEEKLRQINAILRERTNYMKNLESEREQALRYQKLQKTIKICKASIINRNILDISKKYDEILKKIKQKEDDVSKIEIIIKKISNEITLLNDKIELIAKTIQHSSGVEQDNLLEEISILKQEFAGMIARKENYDNKLTELDRREKALEDFLISTEKEIVVMMQEKGKNKKKDLEDKKKKVEEFEKSKREYYQLKSNLSSVNFQLENKKRQLYDVKSESKYILEQIENIENEIEIKDALEIQKKKLIDLKRYLENNSEKILELNSSILLLEKESAVLNQIINDNELIKKEINKVDICPLCQTKVTEEHKKHVMEKAERNIQETHYKLEEIKNRIDDKKSLLDLINIENNDKQAELNKRQISIVKLDTIKDKKEQLKRNDDKIKILEEELKKSEDKKKSTESEISIIKINEEKFESLKLEISELERSEERNLGFEISTKQRELERIKLAIKQIIKDKEELTQDSEELSPIINEKEDLINEKEEQYEILKTKFQKLYSERNVLQDNLRKVEHDLINKQNDKRLIENDVNNFKIERAQINAKIDTLKDELKDFYGVDFINLPVEKLKEKIENIEAILLKIGNVNLRALEIYESIKEEYEKIKEKVDKLESEKQGIIRVIEQIDRKKKKTFINTLNKINELFSRNFSQLSEKGIVILEPQDKKEIFNAGLDIIVKVGTGKYFDVTSLSGGEQSLVALSLIFAIQDLNPYCFYIFDEIDAALDKRNSEKLTYLLRKHMKSGQYLLITHNDSIISESSNILFGVSMQDGISKIVSLEV